tara:strand:- start:3019 stop:3210 length:192 start_codon:yes stop_codon:yes gene_type:complete
MYISKPHVPKLPHKKLNEWTISSHLKFFMKIIEIPYVTFALIAKKNINIDTPSHDFRLLFFKI